MQCKARQRLICMLSAFIDLFYYLFRAIVPFSLRVKKETVNNFSQQSHRVVLMQCNTSAKCDCIFNANLQASKHHETRAVNSCPRCGTIPRFYKAKMKRNSERDHRNFARNTPVFRYPQKSRGYVLSAILKKNCPPFDIPSFSKEGHSSSLLCRSGRERGYHWIDKSNPVSPSSRR